MLYQHAKFQQNPSIGFGVMLWTKNADGRTEGLKDGETKKRKPIVPLPVVWGTNKGLNKRVRVPRHQYNFWESTFRLSSLERALLERVANEVLGLLPVNQSGNIYIMVEMDYFT